jgi:hypothetical protein
MVASAAVGAAGSISQGQAQARAYKAQAQAQEWQANLEKQNADVARQQAAAQEESQRRKFDALQGEALAGVAQSGTGFEGSNLDLLKQNQLNNELDALTIRYQGENQARGLQAQADISRMNAGILRDNADSAITASYFNAGSNLLSGASSYYMFKEGVGPYKK